MAKKRFFTKHHIVASAIKKDLLYFVLPALLVFTAGLVVSGFDGYHGMLPLLWQLFTHPENVLSFSFPTLLGLFLFVAGLTFAIIAVAALKQFYYSTLVIFEGHRLITHGPYRWVRHPIYLGVLIATFGIPISASSLNGLLIMSVLIPLFLYRIGLEESLLLERFGEDYLAYQRSTRKLLPFIY